MIILTEKGKTMADMMPKEQYNFIHGIEEWMLKATNMTDNEAYDFAFRVWQCQNFLARYLSADVAPVRHGRWAETVTDGFLFVSCSACGFKTGRIDYNYCPNCGVKMDGGEDE